ncbi:MAG: ribonuclease R [Veillonellaceae bacterium]|nr:ribonuclease R [Veillonellaceae bacterium]
MTLKERILSFMHTEAYKPLTAEDLAEQLELKGSELAEFWDLLQQLENEAEIIKTRFDKYGTPERMNLVVGRLSATNKGYGFVIPENPVEDEGDVFIPPDAMLSAMNNDRVVVRINRPSGRGRTREGEIIRIVRRANTKVVGVFDCSRHFGFVIPDDPRLGNDIFIPKDEFNGAKIGAKVVAEITKWPERKKSAEGKIVEVLGQKGDLGIEILSIIKRHDLPTEFPAAVERAANKVPQEVNEQEIEGRQDLRHLPIVTIDSEDAKDLDDGVYVERLKNGRYLLGVHIADVSYYVRENTPLDQEARQRGTSVYLVDRVLPMLPPRLSNGICSLNAGVDRLAMSIHMEIDHRGQVLNYEIFPSVIKVHRRLSYNIVQKVLVEHDEQMRTEYSDLIEQLEDMERLCRILRDRRIRRGAVDFDFPELKVKLDESGRPVEIVKRVRTLSESIIEEFMLVANETVAEHMHELEVPFVFRVHEQPDQEKMDRLNVLLHNFGQSLPKTNEIRPMALQKVLSRIAGRPEERIISTVMLRSLKQARYEAENLGHFGLAATYYTHFTSPIRRYPDLIVHRLLRETFNTGDVSAKRRQKLAAMLPEIAFHASERERAAAEAERETVELKKVEYMTQFIGEEFPAIISSVTAFGMFVELENGVEGLVHISSMDDDYYHYVEDQYSLIGERTKNVYRLGEPVTVLLTRTNPEERTLDFVLAPSNQKPRPAGKNSGKPKTAARKSPPKPTGRQAAKPAAKSAGKPAARPPKPKLKSKKGVSAKPKRRKS